MHYIIFIITIFFISLFSCQKVIDINLNEAAPQFVLEASLQEGTSDFRVRVTKTENYFSTNAPTIIQNAVVKLSVDLAPEIILVNENNGYYTASQFKALNDVNYHLSVEVEGKYYKASSYMPKQIILDSISIEKNPSRPFGGKEADSLYTLFCNFKDPVNEINYYQIKTIVNGIPASTGDDILVFDDRFTNGNNIRIPIFTRDFKLNDSVKVYLLTIDKSTFDYFNTLSQIVSNGNNSPAPSNPITNWSGNALGYFGTYSSSGKTVLVK